MDNSSSMMPKDNEIVQYLEPDCRYCEEINGSDLFDTVLQEQNCHKQRL